MDRVNKILNHDLFNNYCAENEKEEKDRVFCHHDREHFLAVARLAWILNLEEKAGIPKEFIYAAALLHDIGRHIQYQKGIPHEQASAELAPDILSDCGFTEKEIQLIVSAIATHRDEAVKERKDLNGLLYRADKLSRSCYFCRQEPACNWKQGKKNRKLLY